MVRILVSVVVMAVTVSAVILPLPTLSDEERRLFLSDMDAVVDCLIQPNPECHPYTMEVRRVLPDLIHNNFDCQCPAQGEVNRFRSELQKRRNKNALKRLSLWINDEVLLH